ncbi:hypothetical protein HBB16_00155 [Pseudonocardia sp. MCCB 268]|nr:hypothetical protein [Pseudonocardia cytotoxica]
MAEQDVRGRGELDAATVGFEQGTPSSWRAHGAAGRPRTGSGAARWRPR